MQKPNIGVLTITEFTPAMVKRIAVNAAYPEAVLKTGGVPLMLPVTTDESVLKGYVDACDGFLFTGGIDINPREFGENPDRRLGSVDNTLDQCQLKLMKKVIEARKPFLAICRGIQIMNVACGGTLYQDLLEYSPDVMKHNQEGTRGDTSHLVMIEPGSVLHSLFGDSVWTNSYHHQSIHEPGKNTRITARTADGIIEAAELENYDFGIGVQWHPEVQFEVSDDMRPLFEVLIKKALK